MNIMLITSSYPPEVRSSSHLMQELAYSLKEMGHSVTVVTTYPSHNLSKSNNEPRFKVVTSESGIKVLRIRTIHPHTSNHLLRGVSQLILPYVFFFNIRIFIRDKIDAVIVYSPPLTLALTGKKIKQWSKARFILNVQDIFPQNALDLGILKNKLLIRLFEGIEKDAYRSADKIAVHSKSNRLFLTEKKGLPQEKVDVVHNWIDIKPYASAKKTGLFRERLGLKDKFVFFFAGVMGPSQGLDAIIRLAESLKDIPQIAFLFVGEGTEKAGLIKASSRLGLQNCFFEPFVSKDEYPSLVKDFDVGLVCLSSKNKTPVVPGKILGYMAASLPVFALLNKESDGHFIIKDSGCGFSVSSDEKGKACAMALELYRERDNLKKYGESGFRYLINNFTRELCVRRLEKLFS